MPSSSVNGVRLAYEFSGGENGVPLILLNGIAMSIAHWKPVIQGLRSGYRILCHDMRGQTLSEKPEGPYTLELHADDLAGLMEELSIGKAHIAGTSYGAEVGLVFALKYPERCRSLTLIDGVSELDPLLAAAVESWMKAASVDPATFYRTIIPWNYAPRYIGLNRQALDSRESVMTQLPREWFDGFISMCKAFLDIDLTGRLGEIACPTRILVGELDLLKGIRFARIMQNAIPMSTLGVIEGAGHAVVVEDPARIAREIDTFIGGGT